MLPRNISADYHSQLFKVSKVNFSISTLTPEIMYVNYTSTSGWSNATVISDGFDGVYWNDDFSYVPAIAALSVALWTTVANEIVNLVFGVWLEDSFGLQIAALSASAAVIGISELGGEGLVALFYDKLGKERAVGFGLAANSVAALLLPLLGQTTFGALLGLFLFYITFEFTLVSVIPMMTEIMPSARATLMSFNVAALSLGRAPSGGSFSIEDIASNTVLTG